MSNAHLDTPLTHVPATGIAEGASLPPLLEQLVVRGATTGPELARRLGISRAAVWKQVEALRKAGLDIQTAAQGYRLARPLEVLDVARIQAALPVAIRRRLGLLENHWRLDSTSSELARRVRGLPDRSFVFADWQHAGRGRRGRQWVSPPAANLQGSCLKRFAGGYAAMAGLSLAVGIAAARALEDCSVDGVGLKWPNDLVHRDAKLGGILIELGGEFMGPCHAVIGIGINVRLPTAMRAGLGQPGTDLAALCDGNPPSRNTLAIALITRLIEALDDFDESGFAAFGDAWAGRDALAGRAVRVEGARGAIEGVAAGVDARGALRIHTATGIRCVDSAEVSVRPA